MFTVTTSLSFRFTPRSTLPPLPVTESVLSAMVRSGLVTDGVDGVVGVVGVVGAVDDVEIWRPENVFTAPARFAATPDESLMLALFGRLTPVIASAEVLVLVDSTVVRKVSALVPEPPT